ncbi:MAG: ATP-binding protein [Chthoniobacterales bacterium]
MAEQKKEEQRLRSAALQNAQSILLARHRAEQELVHAKEALEARTQELAHSLSVMRATLDSTTDGILAVDQSGKITEFNEQFLKMWRVPREVMLSGDRRSVLERVAKDLKHPEEFIKKTEDIYASAPNESVDLVEFHDGRVFERASRIQCIENCVVGRVWSYRDITHQIRAEAEREGLLVSEKEARERAERETRMKDEFLATLSHELRTPLNAILGWANILRTSESAQDIAEGIEVIERNARAQTQIIEDLLDMSRIISGRVRLDVQRVDLLPVIQAAIDSIKPTAAAKEIRLTSVLDPLAGPVSGDPERLQQILWNLLTNALKFTPKKGRVQVVLERVDSHVEVSVNDSGQGIAPDFLPYVFDRFRQADASTTRAHRGLGLGLAIVKNLAELHGGSVRAESAGANQGATFTIALPVAIANLDSSSDSRHPRTGANNEVPSDGPDLSGIRILAVDDEADARYLVQRILSSAGAVVQTASSGAEALEAMKTAQPHVLISDIGMPGEDGYAVIRKVRALDGNDGGNIPAIALTAFARSDDRRRAIMSGFQMHMAKPVEPAELVAMVASLASRT